MLCPHSSFLISVKQEQEAQLAEKGAFQKTRLTVCKLYVYSVLGSFLQLPTLVRWHIGHLYLLKNVYTNIPLMHDFNDGGYFVVTDCTLFIQFDLLL